TGGKPGLGGVVWDAGAPAGGVAGFSGGVGAAGSGFTASLTGGAGAGLVSRGEAATGENPSARRGVSGRATGSAVAAGRAAGGGEGPAGGPLFPPPRGGRQTRGGGRGARLVARGTHRQPRRSHPAAA